MKWVVSFETHGIAVRGAYIRETDKVIFYDLIDWKGELTGRERRTSKDSNLYVIESDRPLKELKDTFESEWARHNGIVLEWRKVLDKAIAHRRESAIAKVSWLCDSFKQSEARQ